MRHRFNRHLAIAAVALVAVGVAPLQAANVQHMTLRDLVTRADRIVRGTVIAKDDTTINAGGGTLPATRYRIRVAETFKGAAASGAVIEVQLLARPKTATSGGLRRGTLLQDLPQFNVGQEYLLVLTRPSAVGLSTTVGLQQGAFELRGGNDGGMAVNGANNIGLLDEPGVAVRARTASAARPRSGPIPYTTLANEIRALVAQ